MAATEWSWSETPSVLVVEHHARLRIIYKKHLSDECVVYTAQNGEDALEQIEDEFDVVFLDRKLPEFSGDEVLEAIRAGGVDCRLGLQRGGDKRPERPRLVGHPHGRGHRRARWTRAAPGKLKFDHRNQKFAQREPAEMIERAAHHGGVGRAEHA